MNVLIAHPDSALRGRTRSVLERLGWQVLEASSAGDALAACRQHRPDVLLLDSRLETAAAGAAVVEKLKADPETAGVRVVAMEAELDVARALAGLQRGIDEYVLEPVSGAEAAVRVRTAGRVKELEERVAEQTAEKKSRVVDEVGVKKLRRRPSRPGWGARRGPGSRP